MNLRITKTKLTVILTSALMLGFTGSASAVPSVVDQYTEQIPTAGGDVPVKPDNNPDGDSSSAGNPESAYVSPDGEDSSSAAGDDPSGDGTGTPGPGKSDASDDPLGGSGSNGPSSVESSSLSPTQISSSDDGMGLLFPLLLLAVAASLVVAVLLRRRRESSSTG